MTNLSPSLVDYVLLVGVDISKPLQFLNKKNINTYSHLSYQPYILDYISSKESENIYPNDPNYQEKIKTFYSEHSLPASAPSNIADVPIFCFPSGVTVSTKYQEPTTYSANLTNETGFHLTLIILRYYREINSASVRFPSHFHKFSILNESLYPSLKDSLTEADNIPSTLFLPYCICIVSHWSFYVQFSNLLYYLFKHSLNFQLEYAIEEVLINLMETPLPPAGRIEVEFRALSHSLIFSRPPPNKLPLFDSTFAPLFHTLSFNNIAHVISAILCEKRILFTSSSLVTLSSCIRNLVSLIFPLNWQHIFVPVLPVTLLDYITAPIPYLIGIEKAFLPDQSLLTDVIIIDFDNNKILTSSSDDILPLPNKSFAVLIKEMKKLINNLNDPLRTGQNILDHKIRNNFFKFFKHLLKDYRSYIDSSSNNIFNKEHFINSFDKDDRNFITLLMESQLFQSFIEERASSLIKSNNYFILFFDEHIDNDYNNKISSFLNDTTSKHDPSQRHLTALPLTQGKVKYSSFPTKFDHNLFYTPRHTVSLISNQNDVQQFEIGHLKDINSLSMKFFNEKYIYSYYIHYLRLQSKKLNIYFSNILTYFNNLVAYEETNTNNYVSLCNSFNHKEIINTNISVDSVYASLTNYINDKCKKKLLYYKILNSNIKKILDDKLPIIAFDINLLFNEINDIESQISKFKLQLESNKSLYQEKFRKSPSNIDFSSFKQITSSSLRNVIFSYSELESLENSYIVSQIQFKILLNYYEARLPQIIGAINELNKNRLLIFYSAFKLYIKNKKELCQSELNDMLSLEQEMSKCDINTNMKTLHEECKGFNKELNYISPNKKASFHKNLIIPLLPLQSPSDILNNSNEESFPVYRAKIPYLPSTEEELLIDAGDLIKVVLKEDAIKWSGYKLGSNSSICKFFPSNILDTSLNMANSISERKVSSLNSNIPTNPKINFSIDMWGSAKYDILTNELLNHRIFVKKFAFSFEVLFNGLIEVNRSYQKIISSIQSSASSTLSSSEYYSSIDSVCKLSTRTLLLVSSENPLYPSLNELNKSYIKLANTDANLESSYKATTTMGNSYHLLLNFLNMKEKTNVCFIKVLHDNTISLRIFKGKVKNFIDFATNLKAKLQKDINTQFEVVLKLNEKLNKLKIAKHIGTGQYYKSVIDSKSSSESITETSNIAQIQCDREYTHQQHSLTLIRNKYDIVIAHILSKFQCYEIDRMNIIFSALDGSISLMNDIYRSLINSNESLSISISELSFGQDIDEFIKYKKGKIVKEKGVNIFVKNLGNSVISFNTVSIELKRISSFLSRFIFIVEEYINIEEFNAKQCKKVEWPSFNYVSTIYATYESFRQLMMSHSIIINEYVSRIRNSVLVPLKNAYNTMKTNFINYENCIIRENKELGGLLSIIISCITNENGIKEHIASAKSKLNERSSTNDGIFKFLAKSRDHIQSDILNSEAELKKQTESKLQNIKKFYTKMDDFHDEIKRLICSLHKDEITIYSKIKETMTLFYNHNKEYFNAICRRIDKVANKISLINVEDDLLSMIKSSGPSETPPDCVINEYKDADFLDLLPPPPNMRKSSKIMNKDSINECFPLSVTSKELAAAEVSSLIAEVDENVENEIDSRPRIVTSRDIRNELNNESDNE